MLVVNDDHVLELQQETQIKYGAETRIGELITRRSRRRRRRRRKNVYKMVCGY